MKKKLVLLLLIVFVLCGCNKNTDSKIYLEDKYYNGSEYIKIKSNEISKKEKFVLFTYNNYCSLQVPCEDVFEEFMKKYDIAFLSIPFEEFKDTYLYNKVKYGPSVIVVNDGKIVAYLDANKDEDIEKYQDVDKFKEWISNYIYLEKE